MLPGPAGRGTILPRYSYALNSLRCQNMKPKRSRRGRRSPAWSRLNVVFEDKDVIVVDKPEGLLTVSTAGEKDRTLYAVVHDYLKARRPPDRVFIVHRLDRDASGLLVFAKSEAAKLDLQEQFRQHHAGRTYLAVTEGRMAQDNCTLESYLAENAVYRCYSTPDPAKGKWAVTHVKVLRRSRIRTLVEVQLETGRKHQIRVHLAEQGHPIVGDQVYGSKTNPLRRLALHGSKLAFRHPVTGEAMEFQSQLPTPIAMLVPDSEEVRAKK
jgi:23S rRNA pseudouridine1911/1915/1917 synthase